MRYRLNLRGAVGCFSLDSHRGLQYSHPSKGYLATPIYVARTT
jgi:hypothetical protein